MVTRALGGVGMECVDRGHSGMGRRSRAMWWRGRRARERGAGVEADARLGHGRVGMGERSEHDGGGAARARALARLCGGVKQATAWARWLQD